MNRNVFSSNLQSCCGIQRENILSKCKKAITYPTNQRNNSKTHQNSKQHK